MGTTSSATSSSSSTIFNGTSRFSQDFQNVISRATAIASLPITQLTNDQNTLSSQSDAMKSLGDVFNQLQTAIQGIQDALGGSSYQADVSDPTKLGVSVGDGAVEGNYSVQVLDPGAQATSITTSSWVNDTATHNYQLSLNGQTYAIKAADNSAASVAAAINNQYGDQVHAAVVNVGTASIPDFRISLEATTLGDSKPDILDGSTILQTQQITGSQANYIVDGQGAGVYSSSDTVQIANGLTVTLKAASAGTPVNITVTRSTSALSDALTAFTTAYNNAVDAVDQQHGQSTSALAGNPVVNDLSQVLSQLATYSSSGGVNGLASLGLDLDKTGHLTFNSFNLMATDITNPSAVVQFLGDSSSGGFLKSATDLLNRVTDSTTGLIPSAETDIQSQITNIGNEISDQQARVDDMTAQMQEQMSAADALIASMEQQYDYLNGLFSAMQTADGQYK
ncbi:MAG TPA: flagellar filament capping protein FliD [Verrucomicrobiae bacterium]|nr:flagellar filament capping protein FliD [Verrucomicrobiae bacterium]